jgi:hypothetical protein
MRNARFTLVLGLVVVMGSLLQGSGAAEPVVVARVCSAQDQAPTLVLDKESYLTAEPITVRFTAPADYSPDAWVGLIPSDVPHGEESVNDQYDITYYYLAGNTEGEIEFEAPKQPGYYDIRMNDNDSGGKEVASATFEVVDREPSLTLEKTEFEPGEMMIVSFTASSGYGNDAWVGIVRSDVPHGDEVVNDQNNLGWLYLNGQVLGLLTFNAPEEPGEYDLRMHNTDVNGVEVACISFSVVEK